MLQVTKFKADHIYQIEKTRVTRYLNDTLTQPQAEAIEKGPYAFTIFDEEGKIVFCGGVIPIYKGRAEAWSVFASGSFGRVREIAELARAELAKIPIQRIEASAIVSFGAAHRWLKATGFELEVPCLKHYHPQGHDCSLYVILKSEDLRNG